MTLATRLYRVPCDGPRMYTRLFPDRRIFWDSALHHHHSDVLKELCRGDLDLETVGRCGWFYKIVNYTENEKNKKTKWTTVLMKHYLIRKIFLIKKFLLLNRKKHLYFRRIQQKQLLNLLKMKMKQSTLKQLSEGPSSKKNITLETLHLNIIHMWQNRSFKKCP